MSRATGGARGAMLLGLAACGLLPCGCERATPRLLRSAFAEVPLPADLEALDATIREGILARRSAVDALWQDADPKAAELGEAYGALGNWHQAYDHWEPAIRSYQNAASLQPGDPRWPYYEAHCLRGRGDAAAARRAFLRSVALQELAATRLWIADLELAEGRVAEAEDHATRALASDPACLRAHLLLGRIALARGDHARAIAELEAVRQRHPSLRELQYPLGMAYRAAGDLERAEAHLNASRRSLDAEAAPLGELPACGDEPLLRLIGLRQGSKLVARTGERLFKEGRYAEAVEVFRRAVAEAPDRSGTRLNLALALHRAGDATGAVAECDEILRRDPDHVGAYFGRGVARLGMGQLALAEGDFRAVLARTPDDRNARARLATMLRRRGDHQGALEQFRELARLDPASSEARFWIAVQLVELKRHAEALQAAEHNVAELGGEPVSLGLLARLLASSPDPALRDGARAEAVARGFDREDLRLFQAETLAMVHAELGELDRAVAWQRSCLAAAQAAGQPAIEAWVRQRLLTYEAGQPSRAAWVEAEALVPLRVPPPPGLP